MNAIEKHGASAAREPDPATIRQHLELLFSRVPEEYPGGRIEIRCLGPINKRSKSQYFDSRDLSAAQNWAEKMNRDGWNAYVGVNPRKPGTPETKAGSKDHVEISFFHFADLDDGDAVKARGDLNAPDPTFTVSTGTTPAPREHLYFELEDPRTDMVGWESTQKGIAATFSGDPAVTDSPRIMRLAGTVSYPDNKKRERGYVEETVTLGDMDGVLLPAEDLAFFTPPGQSAEAPNPDPLSLDNPKSNIDIKKCIAEIIQGRNLHNSARDIAANMVGAGAQDRAIAALLEAVLTPVSDGGTINEIPDLIQSARKKYDKPNPTSGPEQDLPLILSSAEFIGSLSTPDYIVDGILQLRYLYSLTAKTNHGKTAVLLTLAAMVATGQPFNNADTSVGRVCYFAGENPDDVGARWLLMAAVFGFDVDSIDVHFIPETFSIPDLYSRIATETETLGGFDMVIVDTSAAYFQGDNENDNTQLGHHARDLRRLTTLPGGPCVIVACHPTKNPSKENLLPRGGGSFVAEVDGNLTLWSDDYVTTELSWAGKFRGPEFEPISFKLEQRTVETWLDSKGRPMPSVVALPVSEEDAQAQFAKTIRDEDTVLVAMLNEPGASLAEIAMSAGWVTGKLNQPHKSKVERAIKSLKAEGFVNKKRGKWELTGNGKKEAGKIESTDKLGLLA